MSRCTVYNTPAKHNGTDNTEKLNNLATFFWFLGILDFFMNRFSFYVLFSYFLFYYIDRDGTRISSMKKTGRNLRPLFRAGMVWP